MKKTWFFLLPILFVFACNSINKSDSSTPPLPPEPTTKTQILLLGSLHFNQFQDESSPASNFLGQKRQQEIDEVNQLLEKYQPDMVMIERAPAEQAKYDSLFQLFKAGKLDLNELEGGTGEVYQFAFKLARNLRHGTVYCVDYDQSTSQGLLSTGDNIELFEAGLQNFRNVSRGVTADFMDGNLTFRKFFIFLNKPEIIQLSHQQFYNLPAYVQNGSFRSYEGLDRNAIDTTQIGAEFISLFYERNLKIYSNILNTQLKHKGKRILLIMGQTHIGVLQDIIENNPAYEIVPANNYLSSSIY
ncbi:DUF5694 domain-containing protein [Pontibacter akesuensis]|uniref:Uncharacterized protein n=1 Tax=Pontibacter akesuensis TaxID=388950 RepID=A0A1I7GZJ0_9BACT|nr:DUF5694 domain-containing protein [Pontibacter akesuensis]GHA54305.1 hypothetical protein GCM10007389_01990 [Pontibacter akesuensis]SFU53822.1 hypothetical protein SAMN04487941_1380 [Pontibacter akesuensis]